MSKLPIGAIGLLLVCVSVGEAQSIPLPEPPAPRFRALPVAHPERSLTRGI